MNRSNRISKKNSESSNKSKKEETLKKEIDITINDEDVIK